MKRQLILHIGYPKTGTTSIQNLLFKDLMDTGMINYLGRTQESDRARLSKEVLFRREFMEAIKPKNYESWLSNEKLNLLSDEEFSSPTVHLELKYNARNTAFDFPLYLRQCFPNTEIQIVLVLRKQSDLIYSWYAQLLRYFLKKNENTISAHAFKANGSFNYERFKVFDFYSLAKAYEGVFGKEAIRFAMFEDLTQEPKRYYSFWSEIISCDEELVESSFNKGQINTKSKQGKNSIVSNVTDIPAYVKWVSRVTPIGFKKLIRSRIIEKSTRIKQTLIGKSSPAIEVKHFNFEEEKAIKSAFVESNRKLVEEYHLKLEDFERYEYI